MLTFSVGRAFACCLARADISAVRLPCLKARFALTVLPFIQIFRDVPKGRTTQTFRRELT